MRNRCHVQPLLTWSTNAAHPVSLESLQGFHRRVKAKTSFQDDDIPIDDTTTKPLFTPQEKGRKELTSRLPRPKSRQDSERQGTSKQVDHCLYRKMEQGREENPKEPMESDPDSESGENNTFPKKENTLGRTEEIAPGQEDVTPPPPVSDVLGSLARTIYQLSSATGLSRDVELPRYDGSYEAQSFFDNYDAQSDLAQLHYTERLRRLPNLLQGKALHYFRSLKLDKLYYVDARQALIDLFPETTNASFAQFLAIKLTDRSSLEEYYQKKTVCGLQLNLPHKILLESLTDGLPVADQRIVAAVQPNTLQAWYSVVSRVRGTHSASQVCQQTTRTTPNPSFAPSPRYSAPRPWSARPNYSANPPPSSCRYCGAMHWHAQCPKRPAQSRPRPVYRATTYPQHDRTVLSSPAPFRVNNMRAHVTRSPDPLYTTSPAQAVNPSCPMGTSTTTPKQACSDAQDSTTTRNLDIINAIKPPFNQKTLQSFLGAVNVYNKFIPNYARLRTPLNNLLKKDTKWQWDDKCQQAFTALKESLTRKPVLHLYQDDLPCRLYCDASTQGIAGILKQVHPDGKVHPRQYYSRALRPHERNYTISELECLAIVESIEKFHIYLSGTKFTVYSDHQALQWLKTIKNPSGRLFRWSLRLSTYDYEIQYLKGTQQHEADLLSRNPFCGFISARTIKKHQPNITDTSVAVDVNGLHTIRRKGFPPIFLMFNSIPPELKNHYNPFPDVQKARQLASSRTQLKHERDKQRYDKGHQAPHFEIGDLVLSLVENRKRISSDITYLVIYEEYVDYVLRRRGDGDGVVLETNWKDPGLYEWGVESFNL
ncbi:hypothetical protein LAZ67_10000491 [Cordylochernes scorpioides]|uniref:Reverse transcriptase RNase H-like domain-containing protein n=1 Tax=Cordylochernes scorpioides TaxID=51811 RepID=A0ABY6KV54_9ARAC|nr:hypothetical protein LAZ67_10000491 [Cordylochernes scorpioides]